MYIALIYLELFKLFKGILHITLYYVYRVRLNNLMCLVQIQWLDLNCMLLQTTFTVVFPWPQIILGAQISALYNFFVPKKKMSSLCDTCGKKRRLFQVILDLISIYQYKCIIAKCTFYILVIIYLDIFWVERKKSYVARKTYAGFVFFFVLENIWKICSVYFILAHM